MLSITVTTGILIFQTLYFCVCQATLREDYNRNRLNKKIGYCRNTHSLELFKDKVNQNLFLLNKSKGKT